MSPRTVRWLIIAVFVGGIGGMIAGSIADNNGFAITFGLITAAAALGLILVTAVAGPEAFRKGAHPRRSAGANAVGGEVGGAAIPGESRAPVDEADAARVEEQVERLVGAGADEAEVRELVRRAVTLGRRRSPAG